MVTSSKLPTYLLLAESGGLGRRVEKAIAALGECRLCPRNCGVNRFEDELGFCQSGRSVKVASHNIHWGEEPPITGTRGSGTIFFSQCNLRCKFCQNYPISQMGNGEIVDAEKLAEMMISLQERGAHNINLVTPSHVVPQFLEGLSVAVGMGLKIPIVYNSSGYEGMEALRLLDGVVDIYMPDIKYATREAAQKCSDAPDYWDVVRPAIKEMFRQVGALRMDDDGIGERGVLIRHLVLPGGLQSSEKVFQFIAEELSKKVPLNLMSQYFPADRAVEDELLNRRISRDEFDEAEMSLHRWGLAEGWIQNMD